MKKLKKRRINRRCERNILVQNDKHRINKGDKKPGEHGANKRGRDSDYARQLTAKQSLRFYYEKIKEQTFRRYFMEAAKTKGNTENNLASYLERRLQTAVERMGFVKTKGTARQLIVHGHFLVIRNEKSQKVTCPGFQLNSGDRVTLKESSKTKDFFVSYIKSNSGNRVLPDYLSFDENKMEGTFIRPPMDYKEVPYPFDPQFDKIAEYYSR